VATKDLMAREVVAHYSGLRVTLEDFQAFVRAAPAAAAALLPHARRVALSARGTDEPSAVLILGAVDAVTHRYAVGAGAWANSSRGTDAAPNVESLVVRGFVVYVTTRPVLAGEELRADYEWAKYSQAAVSALAVDAAVRALLEFLGARRRPLPAQESPRAEAAALAFNARQRRHVVTVVPRVLS